jgi:hypothetical protein
MFEEEEIRCNENDRGWNTPKNPERKFSKQNHLIFLFLHEPVSDHLYSSTLPVYSGKTMYIVQRGDDKQKYSEYYSILNIPLAPHDQS